MSRMDGLGSLSVAEAELCCDAFLSALYSPTTYEQWTQMKGMCIGSAASESEFMAWLIDSVLTNRPEVAEILRLKIDTAPHDSSGVTIEQEYETASQQHVTECCESLLTMLYGDTVYSEWRKMKHILNFDTEAALAQWCLDAVQQNEWQSEVTDERVEDECHDVMTEMTQEIQSSQGDDYEQVDDSDWNVQHSPQLFPCAVCEQTFLAPALLEHHITTVHLKLEPTDTDDRDPLSCDLCTLVADDKSHLAAHYTDQHPYYKPYMCRYCGRTFKQQRYVSDHCSRVHVHGTPALWPEYMCRYCDNLYTTQRLLTTHIYHVHSKARLSKRPTSFTTGGLTCNACGFMASDQSTLNEHMQWHKEERPFSCPQCWRAYKRKSHLKEHIRGNHVEQAEQIIASLPKVSGNPPAPAPTAAKDMSKRRYQKVSIGFGDYECKICKYKSPTRSRLLDHLLVHSTVRNHVCPHCQKRFKCKRSLKTHLKGVHKEVMVQPGTILRSDELKLDLEAPPAAHPCSICGRSYQNKGFLQRHSLVAHGVVTPGEGRVRGRPFQCPECEPGKIGFTTKFRLEVHVQRVHRDNVGESSVPLTSRTFTCRYCQQPRRGYYNLLNHIERIHENRSDKYTCDVCGYQCANMRCFRKHEMVTHRAIRDDEGNVTGYFCDSCQKTFAEQSEVREHVHRDHVRARKVMCDICGMAFRHQSLMESHKARHSDARTLLCPHCPKMVKTKSVLRRHIRVVHENRKNFSCDQCDLKCSSGANLRSHKVYTHQIPSDFQCDVCGKYLPNSHHLAQHMNKHNRQSRNTSQHGSRHSEVAQPPVMNFAVNDTFTPWVT